MQSGNFLWNEARHAFTSNLHSSRLTLTFWFYWWKWKLNSEQMINTGVSISTRPSFMALLLLPLPSLGFPCPFPQASLLANTHSFCKDPHKFRELVCQEGQHGCEGTQSSSEENEEGKLLLWVNWDFMESCGEDADGNMSDAVKCVLGEFLYVGLGFQSCGRSLLEMRGAGHLNEPGPISVPACGLLSASPKSTFNLECSTWEAW